MNKPLTVEQRRKIAEACGRNIPTDCTFSDWWSPETLEVQWQALISTVARMILALDIETDAYEYQDFQDRYIEALATNNTQEIELLAWELLEGKS